LFFFFQPVVGTGLGWLLLGESITAWFWIGTLLIVGGVLLTLTRPHTQHSLAVQGK
jgi:drug/metabolite transporter (DMT)-like permease